MQTMKSWFSNSANEIANSAVWVGCVYSVRQLDLKTKKKIDEKLYLVYV